MENKISYLGIDLSKKTMDVNLKTEEGKEYKREFKNTRSGHRQLVKWLKPKIGEELHVAMEATNIYWEEIAEYLQKEGYKVSVVNPARIKGYGQSKLKRNKTDTVDAKVIREYCESAKPELWTPPTEEEKKLRSLMRRHENLKEARAREKNRKTDIKDEAVRKSINKHIKYLDKEMAALKRAMKKIIYENERMKKDYRMLLSIIGVGEQTALMILAEMGDLRKYKDARSVAADAGVTPKHHQSGTTVKKKPKMSKMGKGAIRGALYLPAITAMHHNPIVKKLVNRLEAKGKHKLTIIGAVMRKLLHLAYGVVKNGKKFDPQYAG